MRTLTKLNGDLEINKKISINYTNNKFYYLVNEADQKNNPANGEKVIDIPADKCKFNKFITTMDW